MEPGLRPIGDVARELGLADDELELHGRHVAKVSLDALARRAGGRAGRLVLVTAMSPTPHGEGKTTTTIGLVQGLRRAGARALATLRQPTLGPVFGLKGGGTGGGRSRLEPHERVDLHLTGDSHAVQAAHNLGAALIDNHLHHGNALRIDVPSISFPRCLDLSDRALRHVAIGLGQGNGPVRESEFVITSASEVMAILALAQHHADLRARLARIVVGQRATGELVTLGDVGAAGAMAALLADALLPNLVATTEGAPALVHAGPFGNIAHGTSSVVADRLALALADVVVTEAGFGADLGAEKLLDLKCRASGLWPSAAVLVATVRALKHHGGDGANLAQHVAILRAFGLPALVCVNAFASDTTEELEAAVAIAREVGALDAIVARPFEEGGAGCEALARRLLGMLAEAPPEVAPRFLYPDDLPLEAKLETIARTVYGASGVELAPLARKQLDAFARDGFGRLPICVAKTPLSLSDDPRRLGRPTGFALRVREARLLAGAGFVTVVAGELQLMPGLPAHPAADGIDLSASGEITGLR